MSRSINISSRLELICRSPETQNLLIAVPGIGIPPPSLWYHPLKTWLKSLPSRCLPNPAIYSFKHGIESDESRTWENLLRQGGELLEAVIHLKDHDAELRSCAVIFVAHSLGGLVVKEALCAVFAEVAHLEPFRNSVASVIFMGTPHSRSTDETVWSNAQFLLAPGNRLKKGKTVNPADAKRLVGLSKQFERDVASIPILSISETEETTVRRRLVNSKTLLIGREFSKTDTAEETIVLIKANHYNLCNINVEGSAFPKIAKFIKDSVTKARQNIERHAEQFLPPPTLDESTVVNRLSADVQNLAIKDNNTSSGNRPTLGTSQNRQERLSQITDGSQDFITPRRDPQLPCFLMPVARNPDFMGRNDILERLEEVLCPPQIEQVVSHSEPRDLKTFAISGSGGMGKTQIATQFVHRHKEDFDAIFWLHADEPAVLAGEFAHVAVELGLVPEASQEANNFVVARDLVIGWLTKPLKTYKNSGRTPLEEASWLLVFDNVSDPDELVDYWPAAGSIGSILLTSRHPLIKETIYNVTEALILKELDIEVASALLLKHTWQEDDSKARELAPTVVKTLGYLPLAIVQMSSIIVNEQLTYKDFLKRYDEEHEHAKLFQQSFKSKQRPQAYNHTISSVWLLESLKYGLQLLTAMSFFDPDGISQELLEACAGPAGPSGLDGYPQTITAYQRARAELLNSSLISKDISGERLIVHRVTQDAVWARLSNTASPPDLATKSFNSAVTILDHSWPGAGYGERHRRYRWTKCEEYSPHALRIKARFTRASVQMKKILGLNIQFSNLLNELGWYLQERARTEEATECLQMAQDLLKDILNHQSPTPNSKELDSISRAKFLLAETHRNLGCAAAEYVKPHKANFHFMEYNKMMIDECDGKPPSDDSRLAVSYFELATSYIMLENWTDAERCNVIALEEIQKITDPVKAKTTLGLPQINLACVYLLTGRIEKAEPLLEKTLREREELFGVNDQVSMITGRALHALGILREIQGRLDESFQYQKRALAHMKKTAGPYHHRTADMYFKVAQHLVRLGGGEQAIEYLELATKTYKNEPCYSAERARVLFWKGKLLARDQKHTEAKACFDDALKLYRQSKPSDGKPVEDLTESDFDSLVIFWSR